MTLQSKGRSTDPCKIHYSIRRATIFALLSIMFLAPIRATLASNHYTKKQLDALADRVGKTFWLASAEGQAPPAFLDAPSATATTFRPGPNDSFVITDLAGRSNNNPYYAVIFQSGKVGYIRPEAFHEALNVTVLSIDPRADEKEKAEERESEEKDRVEWIRAQPWSAAVKEAAIKKQPVPGLTTSEVQKVLGPPLRVTKLRGPSKVAEEHWFYAGGSVLIFHNGLLSKIDNVQKK